MAFFGIPRTKILTKERAKPMCLLSFDRARRLYYKHSDLTLRSRSETRSSYITVSFSASPYFQKLGRLTVLMYDKRRNLHSVGRRIENAPPTQLRRKILSEYSKNNRYPPITFL